MCGATFFGWEKEACPARKAEALVKQIGAASVCWSGSCRASPDRPRGFPSNGCSHFYVGGHWVPEMIHVAGGVDVLGKARRLIPRSLARHCRG